MDKIPEPKYHKGDWVLATFPPDGTQEFFQLGTPRRTVDSENNFLGWSYDSLSPRVSWVMEDWIDEPETQRLYLETNKFIGGLGTNIDTNTYMVLKHKPQNSSALAPMYSSSVTYKDLGEITDKEVAVLKKFKILPDS